MGTLSLESIEKKYLLAKDPVEGVGLDPGLATEVTIDYPGIPRTESAYYMLDRFGRSVTVYKYTRQTQLDVATLVEALQILDFLRKMPISKDVDAESKLSQAREM